MIESKQAQANPNAQQSESHGNGRSSTSVGGKGNKKTKLSKFLISGIKSQNSSMLYSISKESQKQIINAKLKSKKSPFMQAIISKITWYQKLSLFKYFSPDGGAAASSHAGSGKEAARKANATSQ